MNLGITVNKDQQDNYLLHITLSVLDRNDISVILPLNKDLMYSLYKGVTVELKALDCMMNRFGLDAEAQNLNVQISEPQGPVSA